VDQSGKRYAQQSGSRFICVLEMELLRPFFRKRGNLKNKESIRAVIEAGKFCGEVKLPVRTVYRSLAVGKVFLKSLIYDRFPAAAERDAVGIE